MSAPKHMGLTEAVARLQHTLATGVELERWMPNLLPTVGETLTQRRRHAGWIRVYSQTVAGTRWWRVACSLEHDASSTSRWWMPRWDRAITSAFEHLAMHTVKRVPLRPMEEVGGHEGI